MMNKYSVSTVLGLIVVVMATAFLSHGLAQRPHFDTTAAQNTSVTQGVLANGEVQAAQDLKLSFQGSGMIRAVNVRVGDQVKAGQVLARLDAATTAAALDQANAALASAQASYQKILNGATDAQLQVSQAAVVSAQTALANATSSYVSTKSQQETAVSNAYNALLNSTITAVPATTNLDSITPVITGTYNGADQGQYQISLVSTGTGLKFQTSGLERITGSAQTVPVPLGGKGLYIAFPSSPSTLDTWTIFIPNTVAANYQTNYNAYEAALQTQNQALTQAQAAVNTAQAALQQAQANLQLTQTPARPEDVAA
ncbi:MAG: biotin/lipoyl-binding protein, partial [Patescibacteria group bacterium]|nr:biotin/lipoyl-binding protein [Patescibacteria group bacterium]